MARVLNLLGIYLGSHEDLLPPQQDNLAGFWERRDVQQLHDEVLAFLGRSWDTALALPAGWNRAPELQPLKEKLSRLIDRHFRDRPLWGAKDPRLALLLPLWDEVLAAQGVEHCCVMVVRNPLATARSLEIRNGFSTDAGLSLWLNYSLEMLANSEHLTRCLVPFEALLANWKIVLGCSEKLGFEWPEVEERAGPEIAKYLRPDLAHASASWEDLRLSGATPEVVSLYRLMLKAGSDAKFLRSKTFRSEVAQMTKARREGSQGMIHDVERRNRILRYYERQFEKSDEKIAELREIVETQIGELSSSVEALYLRAGHADKAREALAAELGSGFGELARGVGDLGQKLGRELGRARSRLEQKQQEWSMAKEEAEQARSLLSQVLESRSWTMTAPLRGAVAWLKKLIGRFGRIFYASRNADIAKLGTIPSAESSAAAATRIAGCRLQAFLDSEQRLVFKTSMRPEVSIILVLHNRAELTFSCLQSLLGLVGVDYEVIAVDNASRSSTHKLLSRVEGARLLLNDENRGFTEACNQGAATASGEFLLFLNNDTEVFPGTVRSAVDCFRATPGAGAVGGRVIALDGTVQEAGCIVWKNGTTCGYGVGDDPRSAAYRFPREIDYCAGVFLLTDRRTFESLGGLSEAFSPGYFEDVDYCFRLRERNKKVVYDPGAVLIHYGTASASEVQRSKWLERNRSLFQERHGEALRDALAPSMKNLFLASSRTRYRGRILYLDDRVPLDHLGAGFPRTRQILHLLTDMDYFVTLFATNESSIDWEGVRRELPMEHLEIVGDLGHERFPSFWQSRPGAYDVLLVSRWHNLRKLIDGGFDPKQESVRMIYDAEAISAKRLERQRQVLGGDAPGEVGIDLEEELQLVAHADEVWAVSPAEAELLSSTGIRVSVVAHAVESVANPAGIAVRRGLLFVGRLRESCSPNVDGLRWFFQEVLTRFEDQIREEIPCRVVGASEDDFSFEAPEQVRFLGRVADLEPLHARSRIFIAPIRFGAGIPLKILGAAAHGLPVVATSTLVNQLAWRDGDEILDGGESDPQRFASQLARLHEDEELWRRLQRKSMEAVRRQFDCDSLRRSLEAALGPAPEIGHEPRAFMNRASELR